MIAKKLAALAFCIAFFGSVHAAQADDKPLRLGIFADSDSLPFLLCESENLFAREGVNVSLVRFQSAVERDSAFQAGAVDGIISDILATILAVQGGFPVKITSLTDGRYGIAAAPGSKAVSLKDLAGQQIGMSSNSVIHYMVDSFMSQAGVPAADVKLLPVPKMPVRVEMLLSGQIAAAGMPEPFLTTSRVRGATILASTDDYGLGAGVLVFSQSFLASRSAEVTGLYKAYWNAAQRINANPDEYRSLLTQKAGFAEDVAKVYKFVLYKKPRLPAVQDMERAARWLTAKGLLKSAVDLGALTDGRPIQGW